MAALPQFVVLQSKFNNKNLEFVKGKAFHSCIQSSGDNVVSPYTKLEVEVSKVDDNLVHIKNCYNNKYWVAATYQDNWILAAADAPEEDKTKLLCTLFQPTFVDAKTVRLVHVNRGKFLSLKTPANQTDDVLLLCPQSDESENQDLTDEFTVFDWSSIVLLPRNMGLKVLSEDKYLAASPANGLNYMKFIGDDKWSPAVRQEVTVAGDGYVMIKSVQYDKYWVCADTSIILAKEENKTPSDLHQLFLPESLGTNVIGLRNVGDTDYCKRLISDDESINNVISAADGIITSLSTLEVIELVTARMVDGVDFKPLDAKTTATEGIALDTQEVVNATGETVELDMELKFTWKSSSSTWSSSANGSLKVGDRTDISSKIPLSVVDGNIVYDDTVYEGSIEWGVAQFVTGSEQTATYAFKRSVPPMTMVVVEAVGNMDSLEVPFSYTQTNIVDLEGTSDSFTMEDGHYTGTRSSFLGEYKEQDIPILA